MNLINEIGERPYVVVVVVVVLAHYYIDCKCYFVAMGYTEIGPAERK